MPTRLTAVLVFISALALSTGALADPSNGNGNGAGSGNGSQQASGQSSGNGNGNGGANSGNSGNGNGDAGGGGGQSTGSTGEGRPESGTGTAPAGDGEPSPPSTADPAAATPLPGSPERSALEARRSGEAVPLEQLLPGVRASGAEVLEAQLLSVEGALLYQLKVLSPAGSVSTQYFYARTGQPIERR